MNVPLSRRAALQMVASAMVWRQTLAAQSGQPPSRGYGRDPPLLSPQVPWNRTLSGAQVATCRALCDLVLPAEGDHPSGGAAGVQDFLDEWLSAPYPEMREDRTLFEAGMDRLDARSHENRGLTFAALDPVEQGRVFDAMLLGTPLERTFCKRSIDLIAGGYYTTAWGFAAIGYAGNVARTEFPPVSAEVRAHLERELDRLQRQWSADGAV